MAAPVALLRVVDAEGLRTAHNARSTLQLITEELASSV
jgi:hypothetical protein